jgi:hypothetical protein
MRPSNWDDGLNFHLRIIVQRRIAPPMLAPMTMRIVIVVFGTLAAPLVLGIVVLVCEGRSVELVTVNVIASWLACGGVVGGGASVTGKVS